MAHILHTFSALLSLCKVKTWLSWAALPHCSPLLLPGSTPVLTVACGLQPQDPGSSLRSTRLLLLDLLGLLTWLPLGCAFGVTLAGGTDGMRLVKEEAWTGNNPPCFCLPVGTAAMPAVSCTELPPQPALLAAPAASLTTALPSQLSR